MNNEEISENEKLGINDWLKIIKCLLDENSKLKRQPEELRNENKIKLEKSLAEDIEPDPEDFYLAEIEVKANDYDKLLNQQKEFKKYLEDKIKRNREEAILNPICNDYVFSLKSILQKYNEIVKLSDDKTN